MALIRLDKDQTASQFISDVNTNIEEIGGGASVSADGTATALVGALNEEFDGVTDAEELSVADSATDFVDKLNENFEVAADSTPQVRDFEDLLVLSTPSSIESEMVADYIGEKFYLLKKNDNNLILTNETTHYNFYNNANKQNPWEFHGVGVRRSPMSGFMTVGNTASRAYYLKEANLMLTRSRTRCYTNPKYRWVLFGDSITDYQYSTELGVDNLNAGYSWIIGEENHEIAIENNAVSGTGIDVKTDNVWDLVQATNFTPYDICSIFIGSNDYTYGKTKASLKTAYRLVLDRILQSNPSIKIFICTLIERGDVAVTDRFYELSDGIRDLGVEYNIPVLDLGKDCQLDLRKQEHYTLYSTPKGGGTYDKLHPTQEAHALFIAPLFKSMLVHILNDNTLFPGVEPYVEHEWTIGDSYKPS